MDFHVKRGDVVLISSIHSLTPHFYEVSDVDSVSVTSQPACFRHSKESILAVFRFVGPELIRVWEHERFKDFF